jgi:hypothetical protein
MTTEGQQGIIQKSSELDLMKHDTWDGNELVTVV